jgi:hypothetical protein
VSDGRWNGGDGDGELGRRYVDADALLEQLAAITDDDDVLLAMADWLAVQRRYPPLMGTTGVAQEFGVPLPHVTQRLEPEGWLPSAVPVTGGRRVWNADDVRVAAGRYQGDRESSSWRR